MAGLPEQNKSVRILLANLAKSMAPVRLKPRIRTVRTANMIRTARWTQCELRLIELKMIYILTFAAPWEPVCQFTPVARQFLADDPLGILEPARSEALQRSKDVVEVGRRTTEQRPDGLDH